MNKSRSVSASRVVSKTPTKTKQAQKALGVSDVYYCHYKNAIYMGGMKDFQKHGRGIMLHDDGTTSVSSYFNEFRNGHNIFYREDCVLSVEYQKNKIEEIVLRLTNHLFMLRFNRDQKPEGKAMLIDFGTRQIYHVIYRKGVIIEKLQQKQASILNKIFDLGLIEYFIGQKHANAIKLQIQRDNNIASQKTSFKFQAGFYKKGLLNGLGFQLLIKNSQSQNNEFYLRLCERGYYMDSKLNGMGENVFKNGNSYKGSFKAGVFQGLGVLKNQTKKSWVYGQFQQGNLSEMLEYSHQNDEAGYSRTITCLHQRKNSWIDWCIEMPSHLTYLQQIDNIVASNPTEQLKNLNQKKQQVLKKIQDNFLQPQVEMENTENDSRSSNIKKGIFQPQKHSQPKQHISSSRNQLITKYVGNSADSNVKTKQSTGRNYQKNNTRAQLHPTNTSQHRAVPKISLSKFKDNEDQMSFAMDSKRMVGMNKIFKQFTSKETQLHRFNFQS